MRFDNRLARPLAFLALASAWLWNAARAGTCAATTDEAFTALDFAGKPWLEMLAYYDANNHVLHTILVKLSLDAFGWNVVSLRLPALAAGLLYSTMIWRLGRRWFGDSLAFLALCAFTAWAPPAAEYFSLARGYSMALAFLAWALLESEDSGTARWPRVSVAMGLSVASNLVFAIPSAALSAVLMFRERSLRHFRSLIVPGAVLALIINALPLSRAGTDNFYYGAKSFAESLRSIFEWPGYDGLSAAAALVLPLCCLAALTRTATRQTALTAVTALAIAALLALAGAPWPRGRTGVYLAFLILLAALRWLLYWEQAAWPLLLLLPFCWAALPLHHHPEWSGDASSRAIIQRIAADAAPAAKVVIAAEFPYNYAVAFHAREILGSRAQVVRADDPGSSPGYAVTRQGTAPPGKVLFKDAATSVTLVSLNASSK
ncbi:MAG: hypothetical protein HXY18_13040 [Bryobacteraceae bacterium]|nr:hypothetical protein [Bryobacteraceae bacterium]